MGRGLSDVDVNPDNYNSLQLSSKLCKYFQNKGLMGPAGLEPENVTKEAKSTYEKGEKQRVHNRVQIPDISAKWDSLPDEIKTAIAALLKGA